MTKRIIAVVLGILSWGISGAIFFGIAFFAWPEFYSATSNDNYTDLMLWARLALSQISILSVGIVSVCISKDPKDAWVAAYLLFVPCAVTHLFFVWELWPIWYHFVFLVPLIPSIGIAGKLTSLKLHGH